MNINITEDIWTYLRKSDKAIVIYGMGNGADKVIKMCEKNNILVSDFYASDAFVRGQQFHGKTVMTYNQIREKYGDGNFTIVVPTKALINEVTANITEDLGNILYEKIDAIIRNGATKKDRIPRMRL